MFPPCQVFDELLLDADWSVNAGSWMWLSCSSFFQQFFHCYCPVRYGRKADPNGDYIRSVGAQVRVKGGVPLGYDDFLFITFSNTSEYRKFIGIVHTRLFAI